ncbi:MAG: ATP-binding protein [Thermoleophilia bacterium]|nr:ATP-binding protein [Thermoleophilia bacterium]
MNAAEPARCMRLTVDAEPARLADIRRFVDEVGTVAALRSERLFDLKVAVSEACANAVEHSGGNHAPLHICAWFHSDRLIFEISDSGDFRLPGAERRGQAGTRGLGLPLMAALMDELRIQKTPGGGTSVSLCVRLT